MVLVLNGYDDGLVIIYYRVNVPANFHKIWQYIISMQAEPEKIILASFE